MSDDAKKIYDLRSDNNRGIIAGEYHDHKPKPSASRRLAGTRNVKVGDLYITRFGVHTQEVRRLRVEGVSAYMQGLPYLFDRNLQTFGLGEDPILSYGDGSGAVEFDSPPPVFIADVATSQPDDRVDLRVVIIS